MFCCACALSYLHQAASAFGQDRARLLNEHQGLFKTAVFFISKHFI